MDNQTEDWEKWERIKAEKEKASREASQLKEDPANLALMDAKDFAIKKGVLTKNPEAYLSSGEKMANIGTILAILGLVGEKIVLYFLESLSSANQEHFTAENSAAAKALTYLYDSFRFISFLAPILAVAAVASAIWYYYKTKKKAMHIIVSVIIIIAIFFLNQWLTPLIMKLFQSR